MERQIIIYITVNVLAALGIKLIPVSKVNVIKDNERRIL